MLATLFLRLLAVGQQLREEERGDSTVSWVVLALGLAAAAAVIVATVGPALADAAQRLVSNLGG
jgi:hypothetical protein